MFAVSSAGCGAVLVRFCPLAMSVIMTVTAGAQLIIFLAALFAGFGFVGPATVFFAALWLISAWLFRRAAREKDGHG